MKKLPPYFKITMTFLFVILTGTFLLMLPISSNNENISFINALFTATTSVCVTGLTVIPDLGAELTIFGKVVVAVLIEIGGLSFITLATFIMAIFGTKIHISDRYLLREQLNQNSLKGIISFVKKVVFVALTIQLFGVILNCFALMPYYDGFFTILGYSMFHTISSFNNAGLDIFGSTSLIKYAHDYFLNINTMLLIVLGGLGFSVIMDVFKNRRFKKFNINTKIVLITTFLLILSGALFLKLANNSLTMLECFFMSITSRTAGFQSIDCANLNPSEYSIITFLMFIGASPGSTGGGIKTSTFFVLIIAVMALALNKKPNVFKREIAKETISKAFVITTIALMTCAISTFLITLIDRDVPFNKILFEVVSAFSTTGLSMGITTSLHSGSLLILIFLMFFGRLGPLTIIGMVNKNWNNSSANGIKYVEEKVVIG